MKDPYRAIRRGAAAVCRMAPVMVLLLAGCRRDAVVDVTLPAGEPVLVTNGLFTPDSVWTVFVSSSVPALGTAEPEPVRTARVLLFEDDLLVDTLDYRAYSYSDFSSSIDSAYWGIYRADGAQPRPGHTYRLVAEAPGFEAVRAEDALPTAVPLLSASYRDSAAFQDVIGPLAEITLRFQDPAGESNFYNIRAHVRTRDTEFDQVYSISYGFSVVSDLQDDFFGANPSDFRDEDALLKEDENGVTFSDTFFDGEEQEVRIQIPGGGSNTCGGAGAGTTQVCEVVVEFAAVTEALYRYHRTLHLQRVSIDNPFAEPVRVYSNLSNGFGIFAGYTVDPWIFERPLQSPEDEGPTGPGSP